MPKVVMNFRLSRELREAFTRRAASHGQTRSERLEWLVRQDLKRGQWTEGQVRDALAALPEGRRAVLESLLVAAGLLDPE